MSKIEITPEMQQPVVELIKVVDEYQKKKDSFDPKELQDCRDRMSLNLFYCADIYSSIRANAEYSDYERKRNFASEEEGFRNTMGENGKKLTAAQAANQARLANKDKEEDCVRSNQRYYKIRLIIDSTTAILHSISSRLNQISK